MDDLISRQAALDVLADYIHMVDMVYSTGKLSANDCKDAAHSVLECLPAAEPTLRERALMLLLNWVVECGFGYDNFPEEYERYKDEIEDMSYIDGMIYIAEKEVERNG